MKLLSLLSCATLAAATCSAQLTPAIFPKPQQSDLRAEYTDVKTAEFILLDPAKPREGAPEVPQKEGAYAIEITPGKVIVYAYDEAGRFYAKQTLSQLLIGVEGSKFAQKDPFKDKHFEAVVRLGQLPMGTIIDWPDMPYRGVVEGYYGTPWTIDDRKSQIEFYGRNKMNTYIWAPKDDPYHHGFRSREPYPADVAAQISELCALAEKNHVKFVWAIHPANTVDWSKDDGKPDMDLLVKKLELMYELGVRHFGVFVDDSNGEINQAKLQAKLCTYLTENFINKKSDVGPVIMCPTGYSRSWTPAPWLKELGENLHEDIRVMWTGDGVAWKILLEGQEWVHKALGRPTFIWWNWPCTDYCRSQLAMGRTYDLSQDPSMKQLINGFVSNPMEWPEASKLGVFGVGDYAWNIVHFDSHHNWHEGIKRLFPSNPEAMQIFANHNSDLGNNGHGFGREESHEFTPTITAIEDALNQGTPVSPELYKKAREEYDAMIKAASALSADKELAKVQQEIGPWIDLFGTTGSMGSFTVRALGEADPHSRGAYISMILASHKAAEALREGEKKPFVGYKVLTPFTYRLIDELSANLKAEYTGQPKQWARPRFSSSAAVNENTARYVYDEDEQTAWTQNFAQKEGEWYMLDYGSPQEVKTATLIMGGNRPEDFIAKGQMEYSLNGKEWKPLAPETEGARVFIDLKDAPVSARYLRYRTITPQANKKWLNIATFAINRPNEVLRSGTDIPAWAQGRVIVNKKKGGYTLNRIMENVSVPAGSKMSMEFPVIEQADEIVMDLESPVEVWGELVLVGKDGEKVISMTEAEKDLSFTSASPASATRRKLNKEQIPAGLRSVTLRNKSGEAAEIKLKDFYVSFPAKVNADVHALTDGNILTAWDTTHTISKEDGNNISSDSMTHIPLPEGTTKVTLVANSHEATVFATSLKDKKYIGIRPSKNALGAVVEYDIPEGSDTLSFAQTESQPSVLIYEVYFSQKK